MSNKRSAKIIVSIALVMLSMISIDIFAADPSFSITPVSGTQLKLQCAYDFNIVINPNAKSYNGFDSTIKFDDTNISFTHKSMNPFFTSTTGVYIANGNLFRSYGVRPGGSSSSVLNAENFIFSTTHNILSTSLQFTTRTGSAIRFDPNTTDDGAVINSSVSSLDILSGVTNAGYTFTALPCIIDTESPLIMNTNPLNNGNYIPTGHIVSFTLYDRAGAGVAAGIPPLTTTNNRTHYRYSGLNTSNLANYVPAPTSVDNQEGVNSGSIHVNISCPTCARAWTYTYTPANLNIIPRTGTSSINRYTWDSADRGYTVSFPAPLPDGYEVEKEVTVSVTASDNANEVGINHTGAFSFKFNSPVKPIISIFSPNNGATYISTKISPIIFTFVDARAGINTGSIKITIPEIHTGSTLIYTGKTYSGSDLTITTISGQPGLGNSGSYQVSFVPTRYFPDNASVLITGYVKDLANTVTTGNRQFSTRPSCAYFGCAEVFEVNILSGMFSGIFGFSGSLTQVTGTNLDSPYPYLTGPDHDILMCGLPYAGITLNGNIGIYNTSGAQINGTIFTGDKLYITGMDGVNFILSGNVVIIQ